MAYPRPLVWIATPLKHLAQQGVAASAVFHTLAAHYREPLLQLSLVQDLPWVIDVVCNGGPSVALARNRILTDFMKASRSPNDRLFFNDYDLIRTSVQIVDIINRDLPIVGGIYTTRENDSHWALNPMAGASPTPDGRLTVLELATGFKCFKRSAIEQVLRHNPSLLCESDGRPGEKELGCFSMGPVRDEKHWPGRNRWLTEDYWFDHQCRQAGIEIVADLRVKLKHHDDVTGKIYPEEFPPDPGTLPLETIES